MINMLQYFLDEMVSATLKTKGDGARNTEGVWVPGVETESTIKIIALQPVTGDDLKMLPEGEDTSEFMITYVESVYGLRTRSGASDADQITVGSDTYEVFSAGNWTTQGLFKSYIVRRFQP